MSTWMDVSGVEELPVGGRRIVETDFFQIAVFHLEDGFYAIEDICTHDGGELASGRIEGDEIICPRHGARFCIRTGKVMSPPAYEDVRSFPVRVQNGRVQVLLEEDE